MENDIKSIINNIFIINLYISNSFNHSLIDIFKKNLNLSQENIKNIAFNNIESNKIITLLKYKIVSLLCKVLIFEQDIFKLKTEFNNSYQDIIDLIHVKIKSVFYNFNINQMNLPNIIYIKNWTNETIKLKEFILIYKKKLVNDSEIDLNLEIIYDNLIKQLPFDIIERLKNIKVHWINFTFLVKKIIESLKNDFIIKYYQKINYFLIFSDNLEIKTNILENNIKTIININKNNNLEITNFYLELLTECDINLFIKKIPNIIRKKKDFIKHKNSRLIINLIDLIKKNLKLKSVIYIDIYYLKNLLILNIFEFYNNQNYKNLKNYLKDIVSLYKYINYSIKLESFNKESLFYYNLTDWKNFNFIINNLNEINNLIHKKEIILENIKNDLLEIENKYTYAEIIKYNPEKIKYLINQISNIIKSIQNDSYINFDLYQKNNVMVFINFLISNKYSQLIKILILIYTKKYIS